MENEVTVYKEFIGETVSEVYVDDFKEYVIIAFESGKGVMLKHDQECCEEVVIDDINGDINDLAGQRILMFTEVVSDGNNLPEEYRDIKIDNYSTWSFYTISTLKDDITIRWYGSSNGYYSEIVDVISLTPEEVLRKINIRSK